MSLLTKLERLIGLEKKRRHKAKPKRRTRRANGEFKKRKR
jgi:hypothetical protein